MRARFVGNWVAGGREDSKSLRRRLMACLRLAHRMLGLKREKLALGQLGGGTLASLLYGSAASAVLAHAHGRPATSILEDDPRCANCGGIIAALASAATRRGLIRQGLAQRGLLPLAAAATISLLAAVGAPSSAFATCSTGGGVATDPTNGNLCVGGDVFFPANVTAGSIGIAIGANVNATNFGSSAGALVIGNNSAAVGTSIAIGGLAFTNAGNAIAIGQSVSANTAGSIVIGNSSTTPTSTVSVGAVGAERTITNVAAGRVTSTSTDAINGSELYAVQQAVNKLSVGGASGPVQYSNAATPTTPNGGTATQDVTLVGATSGSPVALHNLAAGTISSTSTDAINGSQLNQGLSSVATALGGTSSYNPTTNTVTAGLTIGGNTYNSVQSALTALGGTSGTAGVKYFHANSTGPDSNPIGTDSVAIGTGATANNKNDVALGANSSTSAAVGTSTVNVNGTNYNVAGTTPVGTVSVGSAGNERTITNVAAGRVTSTSTDAVNGSELYATNQAVAKLSAGASGPVQYSNAATPTTPNGGTATNNVTLVGANPNQPVVISNVAAGVNPTDAVNLSQLQSTSGQTLTQANTYTNQVASATLNAANQYTNAVANQLQSEIGGLQGQINRANSGVAMAMAMGGGFLPDNKRFALAANYGAFSGQGAMAFTGLIRITDNIVLNGSLGYSPEQNSYGGRVGGQIAW